MKPVDSAKDVSKNNSESLMIFDHNVLDCYICLQQLSIPVFQCDNGHIVCSICCSKLKNKCQICSLHISSKRCKSIENLLLSIIGMPCSNTKYGCKEKISLTENKNHEDECIYMPCNCPLLGCDFVASSKDLSNHFSHKHGDFLRKFTYGHSFDVSLKPNDKTIFLQEKNGTLFMLNNSTTDLGNAIFICCIGPKFSELEYFYDISVMSSKLECFYTKYIHSQIKPLKFQSFARTVQRFTSTTISPEFLVIPFDSSGAVKLNISVASPMMQFIVVTPAGKNILLKANIYDTIIDVKQKIFDKERSPPVHQQRLILDGKRLKNTWSIKSYNIQEKTKINLIDKSQVTWDKNGELTYKLS